MKTQSNENGIYWAARPVPVLPTSWCKMSSPKVGETLGWELIHDEGVGVYVHFWQQRTRPCRTDGTCDACAANQSPRFRFYCGARLWPQQEVIIAEFTEGAHRTLTALVKAMNKLRGTRLLTGRAGKAANSRQTVKLETSKRDLPPLPEQFDLVAHLLKLWGMRELFREREGA